MNNLKRLREEKEWSLQQLGDLCGRSKAHLHQLEKAASNPSIKTAYRVAKILDCSVYDIWVDETKIIEETITVRRCID